MPPTLLTRATRDSRSPGAFLHRRKQLLISLAAAANWRRQLRRVPPDAHTGNAERLPSAAMDLLGCRTRAPLFAGVLAGNTEPSALATANIRRCLAEPPLSACVFSGSIEARPDATELLFGSPERSAAPAADFFCGALTLSTSRKLLGLCILDAKMDGTRFRSPQPKKRPIKPFSTHG